MRPSDDADSNKKVIPLILTFNSINCLVKKILSNNFTLLQSDPETRDVFKDFRVLGAFRRDTNLKDSLVRSSLQTNASTGDDLTGTFPCNRPRCKTCAHTNASPQINSPGGPLTIRQMHDFRARQVTSFTLLLVVHALWRTLAKPDAGSGTGSVNICAPSKRKRTCPWLNISALPGTQQKT